MFVVGAAADDDVDACLVGFTSQCSIEPPRFAVFLSKANHTYELARARPTSWWCTASAPTSTALAEHFGGTTAHDDPSKLTGCDWTPGPGGAPVLDDCDWFAGRILERLDAGDHVAFVLDTVRRRVPRTGAVGRAGGHGHRGW